MADEKDIADQPQGGGRKKLIIIIAAAVVLLSGAGAATFFFLADEEASDDAVEEVAEVEKGDPVYLKFEPAFVVHLPEGSGVKMLQVAVEIMTRTPTVGDTLRANDPMIRHHLLNLLEQQQATELITVEGRETLQQAIYDLLSEQLVTLNESGEIEGVFFTQFVMQ
jgi:flagellar FliL protein